MSRLQLSDIFKKGWYTVATWKVDSSHTNVGFSVRHMMVSKVRGRFTDLEGTIDGDPRELENAKVNFKIDAATIHTNNEDRDNHLRSGDFFEVEKYPDITFNSTKTEKTGDGKYDISGDMTIKDVTKQITFAAEYLGSGKKPWGVEVVAFEVTGKTSREEFGLTWNQALETGGVLVGDDIEINIELQANPA